MKLVCPHSEACALRPSKHSQKPEASSGTSAVHDRSYLDSRGPSGLHPPVCRHDTHCSGVGSGVGAGVGVLVVGVTVGVPVVGVIVGVSVHA